jgi:hypothetical protein
LTTASTAGQAFVGLVVVEHDHVGAERLCVGQRVEARDPAVHGDDQPCPFLHQRLDRLWVWPVSLENAIRDVDPRVLSVSIEKSPHERR